MKKILSIFLSVLMVVGSISCLMTLPASAEETVAATDFVKYDYEGYNAGEIPAFVETGFTASNILYTASDYKHPTYPVGDKWGFATNQGYQVYETDNLSKTAFLATWEEPIYGVDGELVTTNHPSKPGYQLPQARQANHYSVGYGNAITVKEETLEDGTATNKYVSAGLTNFPFYMGFEVSAGCDYVLTFKMRRTGATDSTTYAGTALTTNVNTAQGYNSLTGSYYSTDYPIFPNITDSGLISTVQYITAPELYDTRTNVKAVLFEKAKSQSVSTISTKWETVTYNFSVPANGNVKKVYLLAGGGSVSDVYLDFDDITLTRDMNSIGDGVIVDAKSGEITDANDYIGATYTVDDVANDVIKIGSTVEATAQYDTTSPAYKFLGWYKNGTDLVDNGADTITFTANTTDVYIPKLQSKNILTQTAGGFENYAINTNLEVTDAASYPKQGEWGGNKNAGYYGHQFDTVNCTDGTTMTKAETWSNCTSTDNHIETSVGSVSGDPTFTVVEDEGVNSSNALKAQVGTWVTDFGLGTLEQNTNYVLTFKYKMPTGKIKFASIVSTLGVHRIADGKGQVYMNNITFEQVTLSDNTDFDTWYDVTIEFNVGTFTEDVYLIISSTSDANSEYISSLYIDDMALYQKPEKVDAIAKGVVVDENGDEIEDANDYIGATYTVDGEESDIITVDSTVVATAKYDNTSSAYKFLGWFKNGTDLVDNGAEIITFVAEKGVTYTPKLRSKNILTLVAGGFENYADGTDLQVPTADRTGYPAQGKWGANKNAGYYGAQFDENILCADGTYVSREETWTNCNNKCDDTSGYHTVGSVGNSGATFTVAAGEGINGSNALIYNTSTWIGSLGLGALETNKNYVISFKYKLSASYINYAAVVSSLGIHRLADGEGDEYVKKLTFEQVSLKSNTETGTWYEVTMEFSSGVFNQNAYLILVPNTKSVDNVYVDDISLYEKDAELDVLSAGVVVDGDGETVGNSNDYIGYTYTADGIVDGDIYAGIQIVATAKYDKASPAYTFLGWFDESGARVSESETYTFTATSGKSYYPKLQSVNMLSTSGSFEGMELNESLIYTVDVDNLTTANFPKGNKWGANNNNGYHGYLYEGTYNNADGTTYKVEETIEVKEDTTYVNAVVTNAHTYSGDYALKLSPTFRAGSLALEGLKGNTTYSLTYKLLAPENDGSLTNTIKASAIVSSINVGDANDGVGGQYAALSHLPSQIVMDLDDCRSRHNAVWNDSGTDFVSGDWLTITHTFTTTEDQTYAYLVLAQTAVTGNVYNAVAYIDDLSMCEVEVADPVKVDMKSCASIETVIGSLKTPIANGYIQFKVIDNMDTAPVVTANGETLTADENGYYGFKVNAAGVENNLSVRFEGDENLNDYNKDYDGRPLDEYNNEVYLENIWEGDTVYQESALFTSEKDTVTLLYPVDKVVSLRSYSLDINYVENVDYKVTDDGKIQWIEGSRIPVYSADNFTSETSTGYPLADGTGYIVYQSDAGYSDYAISVTYEHSKTFDEGYQPSEPSAQGYEIKKTIAKLQAGKNVNIVVYGDSISCGFSSSGLINTPGYNNDGTIYSPNGVQKIYNINAAPYAPTWYEMLATKLNEMYPNQVYVKTIALGGQKAQWGAENVVDRLNNLFTDGEGADGTKLTPDLMLVGFGVNDSAAGVTTDSFKTSMQAIIDNARTVYPDMEVLMYSPMLPNQLGSQWPADRLLEYETAMEEIAAADNTVGLLKLTSIFQQIIKSKAPEDYLSSYLNHGNDFTARMYATGILSAMRLPISTAYNGVASLRATGKGTNASGETLSNGLRIYNEMEDKSLVASGEIVEFGSIAIRTARLNGAELVKDVTGVATGTALKKSDNTFKTYKIWNVTDSSYIFTSYLTKIPETRYNETYSIRTYMIDKDNNVYYGEVQEVCVYDILNAIDNGHTADGSEQSQDDIDAFNIFLEEGTPAKYADWCTENDRDTGGLYEAYISAQQ